MELVTARARRRFQRGLKRKPMALIKKLRKAKKDAPAGEKPEVVKTHLRDMMCVLESGSRALETVAGGWCGDARGGNAGRTRGAESRARSGCEGPAGSKVVPSTLRAKVDGRGIIANFGSADR